MYEVINENLGIAKCSLMDLTDEQVNQFLGQWESGAKISSLILFYDKEDDLIVLNSSSKAYQFWNDIVEAYLIAEGENKKRVEEELDKYSKDIRKVLDNCIRERIIKRELSIAKQQVFESEYSPVLQTIRNECETDEVIKILKEENVKATFFLIDKTNTDYLIKRMYDEGHTIGLHTASHNYKYIYSSTTNFIKDIEKIQEKVARITGEKSSIIRFPGGSSNTVSSFNPGIMCTLSNMVIEKGYHYFDWNVSSGDAGSGRSKKNTYRNVTNNLSKNRANVVLMHDIYDSTVDAVKDIIKYGKDNGYTFEKITMDTEMYTHYVNN